MLNVTYLTYVCSVVIWNPSSLSDCSNGVTRYAKGCQRTAPITCKDTNKRKSFSRLILLPFSQSTADGAEAGTTCSKMASAVKGTCCLCGSLRPRKYTYSLDGQKAYKQNTVDTIIDVIGWDLRGHASTLDICMACDKNLFAYKNFRRTCEATLSLTLRLRRDGGDYCDDSGTRPHKTPTTLALGQHQVGTIYSIGGIHRAVYYFRKIREIRGNHSVQTMADGSSDCRPIEASVS